MLCDGAHPICPRPAPSLHVPPVLSRRHLLGQAALHTPRHWVSRPSARARPGPAPTLALQAADLAAAREFWPVVVVGTGYGAAVTARRLAEAGTTS